MRKQKASFSNQITVDVTKALKQPSVILTSWTVPCTHYPTAGLQCESWADFSDLRQGLSSWGLLATQDPPTSASWVQEFQVSITIPSSSWVLKWLQLCLFIFAVLRIESRASHRLDTQTTLPRHITSISSWWLWPYLGNPGLEPLSRPLASRPLETQGY